MDDFLKHIQKSLRAATGRNIHLHIMHPDGDSIDWDALPEDAKRVVAAEMIEHVSAQINSEEHSEAQQRQEFIEALARMRDIINEVGTSDEEMSDEQAEEMTRLLLIHSAG